MTNTSFSSDINMILSGLQSLQHHIESELDSINNRIDYLDSKQSKDEEFFKNLEILLQQRNK